MRFAARFPPSGQSFLFATRLEAWRVGSGSMPELLLTGGPGATTIIIPGGIYQLWIVAINSKGRSLPGPIQNWTAV